MTLCFADIAAPKPTRDSLSAAHAAIAALLVELAPEPADRSG